MSISVAQALSATGVPSFVKNASVTDDGDYDFRTKEATYISFVRALVKGAAEDISSATTHAKFWGIEGECKATQEKLAALQAPTELRESDYALVFSYNDRQIKKFASVDGETTREAAIAFYDQRNSFGYPMRAMAAQNLLNKAAAFNVELPSYVHNYLQKAAAFGTFSTDGLEDIILIREQTCSPEFQDELQKVSAVIEEMIASEKLRTDHDFLKEAMTAIDNFDSMTGFNGKLVEEHMSDDLVVSALEKVASEQSYCVRLVNGAEFDVRNIKKAALTAVNPDLAYAAHDKLAAILPTLPRDDADLLTQLSR